MARELTNPMPQIHVDYAHNVVEFHLGPACVLRAQIDPLCTNPDGSSRLLVTATSAGRDLQLTSGQEGQIIVSIVRRAN